MLKSALKCYSAVDDYWTTACLALTSLLISVRAPLTEQWIRNHSIRRRIWEIRKSFKLLVRNYYAEYSPSRIQPTGRQDIIRKIPVLSSISRTLFLKRRNCVDQTERAFGENLPKTFGMDAIHVLKRTTNNAEPVFNHRRVSISAHARRLFR